MAEKERIYDYLSIETSLRIAIYSQNVSTAAHDCFYFFFSLSNYPKFNSTLNMCPSAGVFFYSIYEKLNYLSTLGGINSRNTITCWSQAKIA